jgi:putative addiction module killer protein
MREIIVTDTFLRWITKPRDRRARAKVFARVDRLRMGHAGDAKRLDHGIQEMRIHHGPGYRVYFQQREAEVYVVLCGGDKASQNDDLETARRIARRLET